MYRNYFMGALILKNILHTGIIIDFFDADLTSGNKCPLFLHPSLPLCMFFGKETAVDFIILTTSFWINTCFVLQKGKALLVLASQWFCLPIFTSKIRLFPLEKVSQNVKKWLKILLKLGIKFPKWWKFRSKKCLIMFLAM